MYGIAGFLGEFVPGLTYFPVQPRMRERMESDGKLVMTDSGGIQEETTALGISCLTIRENTERPVTIEEGANSLVGTTAAGILSAFEDFKNGRSKKGRIPQFWDGKASERIVNILLGRPYEPFKPEVPS